MKVFCWSGRAVETASSILHRLSFDFLISKKLCQSVLWLPATTGFPPCGGDLRSDQRLGPEHAEDELSGCLAVALALAMTNSVCGAYALLGNGGSLDPDLRRSIKGEPK